MFKASLDNLCVSEDKVHSFAIFIYLHVSVARNGMLLLPAIDPMPCWNSSLAENKNKRKYKENIKKG